MNPSFKQTLIAGLLSCSLLSAHTTLAQSADHTDDLKTAALDALVAAPGDKALPIVIKVLASNNSDEVKQRALFVLGQINAPEAHRILLEMAKTSTGDLQSAAIRTIGIGGNDKLIAELANLYKTGNRDVKESVLQAYLIAGDEEAVYQIAISTEIDDEFETAVNVLGAMGATEYLQRLRDHAGATESLIHAYAVAGDTDSLLAIARDSSNPEQQMHAIHGLGIARGGDAINQALLEIFRSSDNRDVREAVMHGMMVSGFDEGLLELFRASTDNHEKAELLRQLVIMNSDAAMEAIDSALSEQPR